MAARRGKSVDQEIDAHGLTAEELRHELERSWPKWKGLDRVRIVHGMGTILRPAVHLWCRNVGVEFELEPNNAGSTLIYPSRRTTKDMFLGVSLRERGLKLTPEQEAELRDPELAKRQKEAEARLRRIKEAKEREDAATTAAKRRRDEALWQAEMQRLDGIEKKRTGSLPQGSRPAPPRVLPASEIKHQEGYWRGELVRVADTDTETLKKEKRTGLEKLAPPLPERVESRPGVEPANKKPGPPKKTERDHSADAALFEEALRQLDEW